MPSRGAGGDRGEIMAADNRVDAGQCRGSTGIDVPDAGMGIGATQDLPHQQARQRDVGAELRPAGDFLDGIDLRRPASNDPKRLG